MCFVSACCTLGCHSPLSHGPIIDAYKAAACIPFSANRKVQGPHTREWETALTLSDGSKVMVAGAQIPGGRITVRNLTTGREAEAANAGDYVYPSDVRFRAQTNFLFVKASGLAAGIAHETWLFEYDLLGQQLVERRRVEPGSQVTGLVAISTPNVMAALRKLNPDQRSALLNHSATEPPLRWADASATMINPYCQRLRGTGPANYERWPTEDQTSIRSSAEEKRKARKGGSHTKYSGSEKV